MENHREQQFEHIMNIRLCIHDTHDTVRVMETTVCGRFERQEKNVYILEILNVLGKTEIL